MRSEVIPARALAHPLWWVALVLLVVNDHLFKGASVLPQPLVGKLSDVAGLFVAPMVLAALLGARSRRATAAAHLATALGFTLVNLWPTVARAFEAATAATPWPWSIYADPTDLLALPAVLASWAVLVSWASRPLPRGEGMLTRAGLAIGAWACVATSPPQEVEPPEHFGPAPQEPSPDFPAAWAALGIVNTTSVAQLVRVRGLRAEIEVHCDGLLTAPEAMLDRSHFLPAETWLLEPGRVLPLQNDPRSEDCVALLVDGPEIAPRLLVWRKSEFDDRSLPTGADALDPDRSVHFVQAGAAWTLGEHRAVFPAPVEAQDAPEPACEAPDAGAGVAWTAPLYGPTTLRGRSVGADGCHALDLDWGRWFVCLPRFPLPFEVGETIAIGPAGRPDEGVEIVSERARVVVLRGPLPFDGARLESLPGCGGHRRACGDFVEPLGLIVEEKLSRAGERIELDAARTLYLVRAEHTPLHAPSCGEGAADRSWVESVLVETLETDR